MKAKKVFRVRSRAFWACNGQEIRDVAWIEYGQSDDHRLKRLDLGKPIKIEFVDPPPGRCPHCGEKNGT